MIVESLTDAETHRYRALRLRALRDAPAAFGTTFEQASAWPDETWAELFAGLHAFVVVDDGRDVGMVRTAPDERVGDAARLGSLWVAPEARGSGVGERLIAAVIEWARARGYRSLLLDVGDENAPAIALYERAGFRPTGEGSAYPAPREYLRRHRRRLALDEPSRE